MRSLDLSLADTHDEKAVAPGMRGNEGAGIPVLHIRCHNERSFIQYVCPEEFWRYMRQAIAPPKLRGTYGECEGAVAWTKAG